MVFFPIEKRGNLWFLSPETENRKWGFQEKMSALAIEIDPISLMHSSSID